jgi:hypothetical protein
MLATAQGSYLSPIEQVFGDLTACDQQSQVLMRLAMRRGTTVVAVSFEELGDNPAVTPL